LRKNWGQKGNSKMPNLGNIDRRVDQLQGSGRKTLQVITEHWDGEVEEGPVIDAPAGADWQGHLRIMVTYGELDFINTMGQEGS